MSEAETLKARLAREIALTGPMTVAEYVTRCLHDPKGGYYASRPDLGDDDTTPGSAVPVIGKRRKPKGDGGLGDPEPNPV